MKFIGLAVAGMASLGAAPVAAQEAEAGYYAFDVTRSVARRGVAVAAFDVAGAPVSINAYGRKARARLFDQMSETRDLRRQAAAFDANAKPALMTVELRLHF